MDTTLSIRIPVEVAQELYRRRDQQALNVSAFVRHAITRELARTIIDSETERKPKLEDYYRPAVLVSPKAEK
jgi:post-segregation antitoxin (ccd killing protein)